MNPTDAVPSPVTDERLGPEALPYYKSLWLFHEIASEIQQGKSFRDVCRIFEARADAGTFPTQLDWNKSAVHQCCMTLKSFFGDRWGISTGAILFDRRGKGLPFVGLTGTGRHAWALARDFLHRLEIL